YSGVAIAILVFIHFRKASCVVLSLIPVAVGAIWMLGMMGFFNVPFNPANIMTLPLIIGIGVTNGIHILNRFAEEQHPSILARSTGKAVLVSGLTAMAGFGSLILAQHRGIRSLGLIMSTGITTCMVLGLTFLPPHANVNCQNWPFFATFLFHQQHTPVYSPAQRLLSPLWALVLSNAHGNEKKLRRSSLEAPLDPRPRASGFRHPLPVLEGACR